MYNTLLPSEAILLRIASSMESKIVKTEITQKIPIVIPKRDRMVLTLFTTIV
jgi:hypothetical protein